MVNESDTVLGRNTLKFIHEHMSDTVLPSWVNTVPAEIGTKSRGKLSADQWHILRVVYLPVILIQLWHQNRSKITILDNYMDLVSEVVIGSLLEVTQDTISAYKTVSHRYLRNAKKIYPGMNITPNQHNSLHIPMFLDLFGPLHAIRTFFSERMNYLLQQQNTNAKFGEYSF